TLTIMNPVIGWWGEGDEKIWVDGDTFPSHFGTGTEDYYGYAWGGRSTRFYAWPFHAQVVGGTPSTYGYNVQTRTRALDAIPFKEKLQLDMEVWHPREVETAYAVGTYWYAFGGVKHNRKPQRAEAKRTIPQPPKVSEEAIAAALAGKKRAGQSPPGRTVNIEGAIEFEDFAVSNQSENVKVTKRKVAALRWSNGMQLLATGANKGDFVEFEIPADDAGPRRLLFHGTNGPRYGKCRISVQGKATENVLDFHESEFAKTGPVELGVFKPVNGKFVIRFEALESPAVGKKEIVIAGLDCIVLEKP
ncbi:MAG: DUF2961 domain-containing protein, partial [Planctomycetes bacterium]|nr:DUF2961 domain-containing protein [Planctomycetota bacterium]